MKRSTQRIAPAVFLGILVMLLPLAFALGEEGVTDSDVRIGTINDTTGGIAAYGIPRIEAMKALINYLNDQGGINGRKIVLVTESDNYEPPKTVLAFKKLLDVDKVFCFIGSLGVATTMAVVPEIINRKVPYLMVGGNSSKLFFPPKRYIFGIWPTYEDFMKILVDYVAADLNMPNARIAHIFQDDETGRDSQKGLEEQVAKYPGMSIVAAEGFKRGTVDVSSQVLKAREAKPDVVMMSCIFVSSAMVAKEIEKIGWKPIVMMNASSGDDALVKLGGSAVEGAIVQKTMPVLTENLWGVNLYKEAIARYFPESKVNPSPYGFTGFVEMQLGLEGIKRAGRDLTREGLVAALESFKDVDIGSVPPVSYGPEKHWGLNQVLHVRVQGGQMVKITDWRAPK